MTGHCKDFQGSSPGLHRYTPATNKVVGVLVMKSLRGEYMYQSSISINFPFSSVNVEVVGLV